VKVWSRIISMVAVVCSVPTGAQSLTEKFSDTDWPKQTRIDTAPFIDVFDQVFPLASGDDKGLLDPALLRCELSEEQQWQAVGLTKAGIDEINPAAHMPEASAGLTSRPQSIEVRSTVAGCAILQNPEYLNNVPDTEKAFFSTRHLQQPVYIRAQYETGTRKRSQPTRSDNTVMIQHIATGIRDYPWAVRNRHQYKITGAFEIQMTATSLYFEGLGDQAAYHYVVLERSFDKHGKLMPSPTLRLHWQNDGEKFMRVWSGFLLFSYRDGKRHGLNFNGVKLDDGSFQYDCYDGDQALDYYRIINDYDCAPALAPEFGQDGVFRSATLTKRAAEEEAVVAVANSESAVPGMAGECVKAYAAARICQQMPSDPFGIARGICASGVKKKFGGSSCKLPF
jgi:hypothetical protein